MVKWTGSQRPLLNPLKKTCRIFYKSNIMLRVLCQHIKIGVTEWPVKCVKFIECEGWRGHSSLIFLILLITKPNIEVSGWLCQIKIHFTNIFIKNVIKVSLLTLWPWIICTYLPHKDLLNWSYLLFAKKADI